MNDRTRAIDPSNVSLQAVARHLLQATASRVTHASIPGRSLTDVPRNPAPSHSRRQETYRSMSAHTQVGGFFHQFLYLKTKWTTYA